MRLAFFHTKFLIEDSSLSFFFTNAMRGGVGRKSGKLCVPFIEFHYLSCYRTRKSLVTYSFFKTYWTNIYEGHWRYVVEQKQTWFLHSWSWQSGTPNTLIHQKGTRELHHFPCPVFLVPANVTFDQSLEEVRETGQIPRVSSPEEGWSLNINPT